MADGTDGDIEGDHGEVFCGFGVPVQLECPEVVSAIAAGILPRLADIRDVTELGDVVHEAVLRALDAGTIEAAQIAAVRRGVSESLLALDET